jgi:hypothetical protein
MKKNKAKTEGSEERNEREKTTTREQCYLIVPRKDLISKATKPHKNSLPVTAKEHRAGCNEAHLASESRTEIHPCGDELPTSLLEK